MARPYDIRERARLFAREVYEFGERLRVRGRPQSYMADQAVRAAGSVGANLEEGKAGQTKPDFITKNCIALKEARETRYWLQLTQEVEPPLTPGAAPLISEASELIAILTAIIKKARSTPDRGSGERKER